MNKRGQAVTGEVADAEPAQDLVKVRMLPGSDIYNLAPHGEPTILKRPGDIVEVPSETAEKFINEKYAERVAD